MTRRMFDSTTAADIPAGSELVMGYVDGSSAWSAADWDRFPGRTLVRLCIFNNRTDAQVIDVEPGNNDAAGAVPWVAAKWARSEWPTVYCFSDLGPVGYRVSDVRAACDAAGVRHPLFLITHFDNVAELDAFDASSGIVGKQYADAAQTGGHYDASIVADVWPGVDNLGGGDVLTGDTVKDLIREFLGSDEGAVRVMGAILHPGGYGAALEAELEALRAELAAAGKPIDEATLVRDATAAIVAKLQKP